MQAPAILVVCFCSFILCLYILLSIWFEKSVWKFKANILDSISKQDVNTLVLFKLLECHLALIDLYIYTCWFIGILTRLVFYHSPTSSCLLLLFHYFAYVLQRLHVGNHFVSYWGLLHPLPIIIQSHSENFLRTAIEIPLWLMLDLWLYPRLRQA